MTAGVLVTGFAPFGVNARNPTGEVARWLDGRRFCGVPVRGVELPVVWDAAFDAMRSAVEATHPRALIAFGVADRAGVSVESTARNWRGARADTLGRGEADAGPIEAGGPEAVPTTLSLVPGAGALLPDAPSDDAGDYLCNFVFYRAMRAFPHVPLRGFVHVPRLWSPATPDGRSLEQIRAAMTRIVEAVALQASRSTG